MSTELLNSSKDHCGHSESADKGKTFRDLVTNASSTSESCSLQCEYAKYFVYKNLYEHVNFHIIIFCCINKKRVED